MIRSLGKQVSDLGFKKSMKMDTLKTWRCFMVSIRMQKNFHSRMAQNFIATSLIVFIVFAVFPVPQTRAIPEYSRDLPEALKNFCQVCHVRASGGPMNSYGDDFVSYGSVGAIGELDSDDDGFSNEAELAAGSLPGDSKSTPTSKKKGLDPLLLMGGASLLLIAAGLVLRRRSA